MTTRVGPLPSSNARGAMSPLRALRRRVAVAGSLAVALLVATGPADAYRIYLKDGTVVATKDKYRIEGEYALATLDNGADTTIRLAEIDVEKTERLNLRAYTSAVVIEGGEERLLSLDDPAMRQKTLAEYVEERRRERAESDDGTQEARPRRLRRTLAGYVDLKALDKVRVEGPTAGALDNTLARHGLGAAQFFQGTAENRYLVEVITNSEQNVFEALENLSATVLDLADSGIALDALEVYMANESGSRAGMFTLSEENASLLASDQIEPDQFFLQFVEF